MCIETGDCLCGGRSEMGQKVWLMCIAWPECDCQQSVHYSLCVPWPAATADTVRCICEQCPTLRMYTYVCTCLSTAFLDIGSCSIYRLYCMYWVFVGPAAPAE